MRPTNIVTIAGAAAAIGLAPLTAAQAAQDNEWEAGAEAGMLRCTTLEGTEVNLLVHSEVAVDCVYETAAGKTEHYSGETGIGAGLDLTWDSRQEIAFTVLTGGTELEAGQHGLAGNYVGGKASVAAGLGAGAAALVGGSEDNIALNPIAMETREGYGIAAGLTYLNLEPDPAGGGSGSTQTGEARE